MLGGRIQHELRCSYAPSSRLSLRLDSFLSFFSLGWQPPLRPPSIMEPSGSPAPAAGARTARALRRQILVSVPQDFAATASPSPFAPHRISVGVEEDVRSPSPSLAAQQAFQTPASRLRPPSSSRLSSARSSRPYTLGSLRIASHLHDASPLPSIHSDVSLIDEAVVVAQGGDAIMSTERQGGTIMSIERGHQPPSPSASPIPSVDSPTRGLEPPGDEKVVPPPSNHGGISGTNHSRGGSRRGDPSSTASHLGHGARPIGARRHFHDVAHHSGSRHFPSTQDGSRHSRPSAQRDVLPRAGAASRPAVRRPAPRASSFSDHLGDYVGDQFVADIGYDLDNYSGMDLEMEVYRYSDIDSDTLSDGFLGTNLGTTFDASDGSHVRGHRQVRPESHVYTRRHGRADSHGLPDCHGRTHGHGRIHGPAQATSSRRPSRDSRRHSSRQASGHYSNHDSRRAYSLYSSRRAASPDQSVRSQLDPPTAEVPSAVHTTSDDISSVSVLQSVLAPSGPQVPAAPVPHIAVASHPVSECTSSSFPSAPAVTSSSASTASDIRTASDVSAAESNILAAMRAEAVADRVAASALAAEERKANVEMQMAMLKTIQDGADAAKLIKLPILSKASEWPEFWRVSLQYFSKDKYSLGPSKSLNHIEGGDWDNSAASRAFDDLLVNSLRQDARALFTDKDDEYLGKGFLKMQVLQEKFGDKNVFNTTIDLFDFLGKYEMGDTSPIQYEANLRTKFKRYEGAKIVLPDFFKVMLMLRGLRPEYSGIQQEFHLKRMHFNTVTMEETP